jgi:hypothetical protein
VDNILFVPPNLTYEQVEAALKVLPGSRNKDYMAAANNIVNNNAYTLPPFGTTKYQKLIDWEDNKSRSYLRLIHGHTFLGCLTEAFRETNDPKFLIKGLDLINDWIKSNPYETKQGTMAFHDETTALRLQYWLRFYIFAAKSLELKQLESLKQAMWNTAELLSRDFFHSTNTNHGMFQDVALLLFAEYFYWENQTKCHFYREIALRRLKQYFTSTFTVEGVHKEHSPSYHMLVASYIKMLLGWMEKAKIGEDAISEFYDIYKKSEEFSIYIIRPDGFFPPICDTEAKSVAESSYNKLYDSDEFMFAITKGAVGKPPIENDKVFIESGYAIFRDDWGKKDKCTYVLFSAAYNTNYHKHSDDLNLYIYSEGEIITEAGPNGYNYQDPYTKYAYSSFAHNTLVVDGKGLPRNDGNYDKVYLSDYKISSNTVEATGVNLRYQGVKHTRNVRYLKDEQIIIVKDDIHSKQKHEYKLLWHVAPDIRVYLSDRMVELFRSSKKIAEIEFNTTAPIRISTKHGQNKPRIQGWKFPQMEQKQPLTTIEVDLSGTEVECRTEFRLGSFKLEYKNPIHHVQGAIEAPIDYNIKDLPKIRDIKIKKVGNSIEVECDAIGENLKYAYYIYRNKEIIEKIFYKPNAKLRYPIGKSGKYMVRVYVRNAQQQYIAKNSREIEINI